LSSKVEFMDEGKTVVLPVLYLFFDMLFCPICLVRHTSRAKTASPVGTAALPRVSRSTTRGPRGPNGPPTAPMTPLRSAHPAPVPSQPSIPSTPELPLLPSVWNPRARRPSRRSTELLSLPPPAAVDPDTRGIPRRAATIDALSSSAQASPGFSAPSYSSFPV
jgi:hypothetical protein